MATDPRVETIRLLTSIDAKLGQLLAVMQPGARDPMAAVGYIAGHNGGVPDAVLDGPRGDPVVKVKDPRDWSGQQMNGKRFSECPPAYLDLLAERYDYFATKDGQTPEKVRYAQNDARRARGWAARLRAGWKPPSPTDPDTFAAGAEPAW